MFQEGQIGVYIHWPFCVSKCPYCDFNVYLKREHDPDAWLKSYLQAIRYYQERMQKREVVSIYFGGGTPSLMEPSEVDAIIAQVKEGWRVSDDLEVTLEANPTSTEIDKFNDFKAAGINRLSLGVQSLRDDALEFLGRYHGRDDVLKAINVASNVFERFTFDLIYGRPDQDIKAWEEELLEAVPMMNGHLSAYQLTIKEGTAFEQKVKRGSFAMPDEDVLADFYTLTSDIMAAHGMPAYEVSNYGREGHESRHNMIYWHYMEYVAIGPGAHGRFVHRDERYASEDFKKPSDWMTSVNEFGHGAEVFDAISKEEQFTEMLMSGLRLKSGFDLARVEKITGIKAEEMLDLDRLSLAQDEGWIMLDLAGQKIKPTHEGWLRLDSLLPFILKD